MYDRSVLVTAAAAMGDRRPVDLATRLGVARNTAWRLWHGKTAPSALLAAAVEQHYGISARQLIQPAPEVEQAAA
ncbi:XRE family transcriptional regulator [Streptomyces sp. NBC_00124]|uniref:XRE family transcriptional regulator n=1 Tax=Streptomyces sp. NBC_00124 TaxID=2975662 RepID=UPI002253684C|nr:XRE family transcriptional regulator [Streptomyces sp. NBC_00124]MCX5362915.1 XRE family transcriptional regulator [Streptomyces sp. NBC_00124]